MTLLSARNAAQGALKSVVSLIRVLPRPKPVAPFAVPPSVADRARPWVIFLHSDPAVDCA